MMPRSGTAVAGRRRSARCPAAALRKMAVRLLRSIAAAPVIATGLRVSPLLTPLRLDSAAGCVGKKRVRQDSIGLRKALMEHAVPTRANERSGT